MFKWMKDFVTDDIMEELLVDMQKLKNAYEAKIEDADAKYEMAMMMDRMRDADQIRFNEMYATNSALERENEKLRTDKQLLLHVLEKRDQDIDLTEILK